MKSSLLAGASFAHLLGRAPAKPAAAEPGDKPAEDPGRDKPGDGDPKSRKKGEGQNPEPGEEEDEEDDDEEGDDESDDADLRKKGKRAARLRERARCAAIFLEPSAARNPALAAQLAFATSLTRSAAIAALRAGAVAAPNSLDRRMATVATPVAGPSAAATARTNPHAEAAAAIIAAGRKRRGEPA